jgi:hypothetical protein
MLLAKLLISGVGHEGIELRSQGIFDGKEVWRLKTSSFDDGCVFWEDDILGIALLPDEGDLRIDLLEYVEIGQPPSGAAPSPWANPAGDRGRLYGATTILPVIRSSYNGIMMGRLLVFVRHGTPCVRVVHEGTIMGVEKPICQLEPLCQRF